MRELEARLQQQQRAFQATLQEEVDIRVELQTCDPFHTDFQTFGF